MDLAKARKHVTTAPVGARTILLVSDVKDHGQEARDYPLWQERWARLLGGSAAWGQGPVNLFGESIPQSNKALRSPGIKVIKAQQWPSPSQFDSADVIVAYSYLN